MKIAMVVGHDADEQGAYGNEGVSEFSFNDNLLSCMSNLGYFPDEHTIYVLYRSADIRGYSNQMRDLHKRIDALGCEVSIEMHFNSFSNEAVRGHEVLYCSEAGKDIAEVFNHALDGYLPTSNRGVKKVGMEDKGGGFCCRGRSKAIILEPYFAAHQSDFIYNGQYRRPLMEAISEALKRL